MINVCNEGLLLGLSDWGLGNLTRPWVFFGLAGGFGYSRTDTDLDSLAILVLYLNLPLSVLSWT